MRQVGHEILDYAHVIQGVDSYCASDFGDGLCAGKPIGPIDVHGATSAYALSTGTSERQGAIDLVLDTDERVQDHWAAAGFIDKIRIQTRAL